MKKSIMLFAAAMCFLAYNQATAQCGTSPGKCPSTFGCQFQPLYYFTFDNDSLPFRSCTADTIKAITYNGSQLNQSGTGGIVGKYENITLGAGYLHQIFSKNFFPNGDSVNS